MNLIRDPWIPVEYSDGRRARIPAVDISDGTIARILAPRRDFTGALSQLLIGLLQTYFPPKSADDWHSLYRNPPTREELTAAFDPVPFELFSSGPGKPAFMQDLEELGSKPFAIGRLLIDQPGEQGLQRNTDHFVHRGSVNALCGSCAATALFTMQANAPAGGAGNMTGIRGGGPLTTLVFSDLQEPLLWKDLWLNVIVAEPQKISENSLVPPHQIDESVLPWLGPTRTSERKQTVSPGAESGVHHLQVYWAMPRRMQLILGDRSGACDVCGFDDSMLVEEYESKPFGNKYSAAWRHPLTPYTVTGDGSSPPNPRKGRPGALAYPDYQWISGMSELAYSPTKDKTMVVPAQVVRDVQFHKRDRLGPVSHLRVWVFGYDLDKMKPRGWMESRMPLYALPPQRMEEASRTVREVVDVATSGESLLRRAVLDVAASDATNKVGGSSWADQVSGEFYSRTERDFYRAVESIVRDSSAENSIATLYSWLHEVSATMESLFFQSIGVAPDDRTPIDRDVYEVHSRMMRYFHGSTIVKSVRQRHAVWHESKKEEVI
ncbi:MAG: type I-E CRISPR-associated protein Cse1/CasA [Alkalispirochaeta sp.]